MRAAAREAVPFSAHGKNGKEGFRHLRGMLIYRRSGREEWWEKPKGCQMHMGKYPIIKANKNNIVAYA